MNVKIIIVKSSKEEENLSSDEIKPSNDETEQLDEESSKSSNINIESLILMMYLFFVFV